jgi:hydrogenase 3 maturation protease
MKEKNINGVCCARRSRAQQTPQQYLKIPEQLAGLRIAILGVGNELNGDDAAGMLVARGLREAVGEPNHLLVIEAGPAPESFGGPLRRFQPDLVLLVDAAELNQPPGSAAWIDWSEADSAAASTHTLSPSLFAQFLIQELGCRVAMIGIQPEHLDFDRPVSKVVRGAVEQVIEVIKRSLLRD